MGFFLRDAVAEPTAVVGPVVEWEETDCLLCGGRSWSPLVEAPDGTAGGTGLWFVVVQCQDCGLCFTNPRPSPGTIGQFHPHRPMSRRVSDGWHSHWWRAAFRWLARPRRDSQLVAPFGARRLLDLGCGDSSYLEQMQRLGWTVTPLEASRLSPFPLSPSPRERGRRKGDSAQGLPIRDEPRPHLELRSEMFDLVTMHHSLPCLHAPLQALREIHRLLAPGGRLLVVTPNIDSLPFRWFGHVWYGLDLPRHLTHFAPWTLYLMLHKAGFRMGPIRMVGHSGWLRRSAGLACRSPEGTRRHRWLAGKPLSRLATWYSRLTYQADCMMVMAERS
jgi:SAM-dependent methyltransferase